MVGYRASLLLAALSLAALSACSSSQVIDELPSAVGLPADTPARPATPYQYPAVHDMPPPRSTEPMSAEDQLKLEKELSAARDRQEGRKSLTEKPGQPSKKALKKDTKEKPADGQASGTAATKPNP
jgi:hypothetical protein